MASSPHMHKFVCSFVHSCSFFTMQIGGCKPLQEDLTERACLVKQHALFQRQLVYGTPKSIIQNNGTVLLDYPGIQYEAQHYLMIENTVLQTKLSWGKDSCICSNRARICALSSLFLLFPRVLSFAIVLSWPGTFLCITS